ncbi:hypothetical protein, partial [Enterococcus faecium]|uniref:hypothetical protein n=1 Tax=Enterococcus faecium TaxID=1352 RepID=UPI00292F43A6
KTDKNILDAFSQKINIFITNRRMELIFFKSPIAIDWSRRDCWLVNNNTYYTKLPTGNFIPNTDYDAMYQNASDELKISGILRVK